MLDGGRRRPIGRRRPVATRRESFDDQWLVGQKTPLGGQVLTVTVGQAALFHLRRPSHWSLVRGSPRVGWPSLCGPVADSWKASDRHHFHNRHHNQRVALHKAVFTNANPRGRAALSLSLSLLTVRRFCASSPFALSSLFPSLDFRQLWPGWAILLAAAAAATASKSLRHGLMRSVVHAAVIGGRKVCPVQDTCAAQRSVLRARARSGPATKKNRLPISCPTTTFNCHAT